MKKPAGVSKLKLRKDLLESHLYNAFGEPKDALALSEDNYRNNAPAKAQLEIEFKEMLHKGLFSKLENEVDNIIDKLTQK